LSAQSKNGDAAIINDVGCSRDRFPTTSGLMIIASVTETQQRQRSAVSIIPVKRSSRTGSVPGNTLAGIAIFRELAPDVIAMLSQRCRWRRYGPGQTILQHRDEGRDVYFVVSGRVCAVYYSPSGREVHFNDLQAGEVFGELAAIDGQSRATDIVSATDTLIASMSADLFWDVLRRYEPVCAATLRRLTGMARAAVQRVVELSTLPVRSRLHAELLRLASSGASGSNRKIAVIDPAPTHAEIASRISTHREAVTRELNDLARANLIERRGTALIIRDTGALANMAQDALMEQPRVVKRRAA
jgi:CRP/FNR family transcriptional regulator, cyclic AMP receptor protein